MKILTIAEHKENALSAVSYEAIGVARSLGGEVVTAVLGSEVGPMADKLAAKGSRVAALAHAELKYFHDETYAGLLAPLIEREKPDVILGSATFYGKALMGRLAALCGGAMASDCTAVSVNEGTVTALRPAFGGNVILKVHNNHPGPFFISLRPKAFPEAGDQGGGRVVNEPIAAAAVSPRARVTTRVSATGGKVSLTEADIVVSAGRGIRAAEHFKMIEELADALKGAVGASRAIVDAGWVEYLHQVGQTGKTVNPKLYIAVGISGAVQHLVGMRSSKTIVAINRDKDAPIFNIATYGIVGDLFEVVPVLTRKLREIMK